MLVFLVVGWLSCRDAPSSLREPQKGHLKFSRFSVDSYASVGGLLECFSPALLDMEVKVS